MVALRALTLAIFGLGSVKPISAKLTWASTKYLYVFGDSYTTTGYNVSAGVDSPTPGYVRIYPNTSCSIS